MTEGPLSDRLTAIFLEELEEQLRRMNTDLLALEATPSDPGVLKSLLRGAHTLKGAARAAGVPEIERTCHALETLLTRARGGQTTLSQSEYSVLFSALDALEDAGARMRAGETLENAPIAELSRSLARDIGSAPAPARDRATGDAGTKKAAGPPTGAPGPDDAAPTDVERGPARLSVDPEKVDALLASAGELLVATGRLADRPARVTDLYERTSQSATGLRRLVRRSRSALEAAGAERAADELVRRLEDLVRVSEDLVGDAAREARLMGRLAGDLGGRMRALRMRPFSEACEPLGRVVRDVASAGGKKVRLDIVGADVAADRAVLDAVREALLHLVRNAVDHGIEAPEIRAGRGKPETGTVTVQAELRGERLFVTVADDGSGLDAGAIRAQLERSGRPAPENNAELGRLLLEAGLSTRAEATAISGRGVGLDVVRSVAERVRGHVDVTWKEDAGTTFVLECPLSLAALRAVLVRAGDQVLALATADVERVGRVDPGEVRHIDGRPVVPAADGPVPLASLAALLGPPLPALAADRPVPVVVLRSGDRRLAVAVDELLTEAELMVRPIQPLQTRPPQIAGMSVLGDGRLALVLDGAAIIAMGISLPSSGIAAEDPTSPDLADKIVLVVDDSITTRTLEESILTTAGYQVMTAGDGAEAWRILQTRPCDLVVSDVEMPGLDGFELCEKIRANRELKDLPVILVTALEAPEQRTRGLEAGADAYLPKSSFDQQDLLATIHSLIG